MELFFQIAGIALVIIGILWGIFFCWIPLKRSIKKIQEQTRNNQREESLSPQISNKDEGMKISRPLLHNLLAAVLMIAGAVMVWIGAAH